MIIFIVMINREIRRNETELLTNNAKQFWADRIFHHLVDKSKKVSKRVTIDCRFSFENSILCHWCFCPGNGIPGMSQTMTDTLVLETINKVVPRDFTKHFQGHAALSKVNRCWRELLSSCQAAPYCTVGLAGDKVFQNPSHDSHF